jgi:predicted HAD superfamily Cof-like phosphohydrolase
VSLDDALAKVRQFHGHIGAPVAERPCLLKCETFVTARFATQLLEWSLLASSCGAETDNQLLLRLGMALEELSEWLFAHGRGNLAAVADAWTDRLYVLLGDAVVTGLPAESLFAEIHRSNLTKEAQTDWPGKALKGTDYQPPDIQAVLARMEARR